MMTEISVVCTGRIESPSEYVEFLRETSEIREISEILVPLTTEEIADEEFSNQFFQHAEMIDSKLVPLVLSEKSSRPQAVNQAVAAASNDHVLLLEKPVSLNSVDLSHVSENLYGNSRAVVEFSYRILTTADAESTIDRYFRSIPAEAESTRPAYAIARRYFLELRGFDESPSMKGILGSDLIKRHERRGGSIIRLGRKAGVVYSTGSDMQFTPETRITNKEIDVAVNGKKSIYRNLIDWSVPEKHRTPLISVAIATKDRADLVGESISSVLYQSFQDFEIVVVDDGSQEPDAVYEAVSAFADPRIKFMRNAESRGVSFARNRAADATDCLLTAVHDDDDIMLPRRLEWGIEALTEDVDASYGSWTNFDHYDGKLRTFITRKDFDNSLVAYSGEGPGHSTWTIPTEIIKTIRYNESLTSSVDHYLATRAAAAGVRWGHIGKVAYLRRVHDFQLTSQDTARQKSGHTLSKFGNTFLASASGLDEMKMAGSRHNYPAVKGAKDPASEFLGYLPDHLVTRDVIIDGNVNNALTKIGIPTKMVSLMEDRDLETGISYTEQGLLKGVSFEELVRIRESGISRWRAIASLAVQSDDFTTASNAEESLSVEARELSLVREKVAEQAVGRLQSILAVLRRNFKQGHLVVIQHFTDVPDLGVPEEFTDAKLNRRLLVRGELGVQICYTVFGFEDTLTAIQKVRKSFEPGRGNGASIFPVVDPDSLIRILSEAREESDLGNDIEDSGLGNVL